MWRYRELLPVSDGVEPVSMGEGCTPFIEVNRVLSAVGLTGLKVYVKYEGANPTGSFKDRGMSLGVTIAKYSRAKGVVVASTGNTAASAAAYAARAGLLCRVLLPKGGVAAGKLLQALLYGAEVQEVEGPFDRALEEVLSELPDLVSNEFYPLNSFNTFRLEGQKTAAYEIVEQLSRPPDVVIVPVGNAGNISAIWKGFRELYEWGFLNEVPRMIGVQASGAAPIAEAWRRGLDEPVFIDNPRTVASAIRIGKPVNWPKAVRAVKESRGTFVVVDDSEILEAMKALAKFEGICVEPASAASLAGLIKAFEEGFVDRGETVALVATGSCLKDPDTMRTLVAGV